MVVDGGGVLGGEHGGQQARSGRKAAGESGIKGERGQGAVERKELPTRPDETGSWGPEGGGHAARGVMAGAAQPQDALWGREAAPVPPALPPLDGAGD